ncbi:hypothetical protein [Vibrio sp. SCSIO 43136]|uniref:hypothetical protein n=1 Tax=Vibrio sp. SCSIO 43136 TaxID=2819101 RepID=UPI0020755919|nr:hypothetical protein [Vibrio sp. SCSIO 43136]USD67583.1 hypothetical protein J4N39_15415 [Vibrio sp. SCSIO 43136]
MTDLKLCLIDETYAGREIYNTIRQKTGKRRVRSSQGLEKEFVVQYESELGAKK